MKIPRKRTVEHTRFGSAYGYSSRKPPGLNISGYCLMGSANAPPTAGPMIDPIAQTNGMIENARAVYC